MWETTVTGVDPFVCEGPYVPPRRKRARVTAPVQIESAAPIARTAPTAPTAPRPISATTGVQVVAVLGLGWYVLFGSGFGGAEGSARSIEPQSIMGKNEAAPVSARQLTPEMAEAYITQFSRVAVEEMEKFGVPASISLAQGLVESRAGDSKLARRNNNHFGIKCFSKKCQKNHCSNFTDDTHKDFFRKFRSPWESWRAHSVMISSGRYASLKKHGRDYKQWAYGLKSIGYATDKTYAEKLIGIIEDYELFRFDK